MGIPNFSRITGKPSFFFAPGLAAAEARRPVRQSLRNPQAPQAGSSGRQVFFACSLTSQWNSNMPCFGTMPWIRCISAAGSWPSGSSASRRQTFTTRGVGGKASCPSTSSVARARAASGKPGMPSISFAASAGLLSLRKSSVISLERS